MPHKSPVTREVETELRERCNELAKKIGINHTKFWDSALRMYCDYIENNPPPVEKHTREKFMQLIESDKSNRRIIKDLELRLKIVEGQMVEVHKANGSPVHENLYRGKE
jgi:hypothetical protein